MSYDRYLLGSQIAGPVTPPTPDRYLLGRDPAYSSTGKDYDGSNDYALRGSDLTGIVDGKKGTICAWARIDGGGGSYRCIFTNGTPVTNRFSLILNPSNQFQISLASSAPATILDMHSSAYSASPLWVNILASWDLGANKSHLYINDVSDKALTTFVNANADYTNGEFAVGALTDGTLKWNGCLSELFFHTDYIDFSAVGNRRKFIDAVGRPVSLGADGSTPFGATPVIYMPGGDPTANSGTGGNFTLVGALTAASTSPSQVYSFTPLFPAQLSDNGYSTNEGSYYQSSPFARFVALTDAAAVAVTWYVNSAIRSTHANKMRVGIWDGTTRQEVTATADGLNTGIVDLAAGTKTVQLVAGSTSRIGGVGTVEGNYLVAAKFIGGTFAIHDPPSVGSRILIYGDSIASGYVADGPTNNSWDMKLRQLYTGSVMAESWAFRALRHDGLDETARETFVADHIAAHHPTIVWLAIGANDYFHSVWNAADFGVAYADLLDKIHEALPSAAIYAQSPIVAATETANTQGSTMGNYRTQISTACATRSWATFVDGSAFMTVGDLDADGTHPTTAGHLLYYNAVKAALGL